MLVLTVLRPLPHGPPTKIHAAIGAPVKRVLEESNAAMATALAQCRAVSALTKTVIVSILPRQFLNMMRMARAR
jgi:hypothetical protein